MFEKLYKEIARNYEKDRKEAAFFAEHGYYPSWAEEHRNNPDNGLERLSTPAKWQAYKAGTLDRKKAVELATIREQKQISKKEEMTLRKMRAAENAPDLSYCSITVEWSKSSTWGSNPTATVRTNTGVYSGHASGCGYGKESAAVAEALNQCPAVLKMLYIQKEKGLKTPPKKGRPMTPLVDEAHEKREARTSNNSIIGYGSGYGTLPYFEGGVGVSCFRSIFEKCGFKWTNTSSGKTFDSYHVEKQGGKA